MYAVIETGGKQFRVAPGDTLRVDTVAGDKGATVDLGKVIALVNDEGNLVTGAAAAKATVKATIVHHDRAAKVIVFKFKRKKQYRRTQGHRQNYTELTVNEISA